MDKRGAIAHFETPADAKKAGYTTPLSNAEAKALYGVNRKDRRSKLAKLRREKRKRTKASQRANRR